MPVPTISVPVTALRYVAPALPSSPGAGPEAALALAGLLLSAEGSALDQLVALLTTQFQLEADRLSKFEKSAIIRLIAALDERREEAALAAQPVPRATQPTAAFSTRIGFLPHLAPL